MRMKDKMNRHKQTRIRIIPVLFLAAVVCLMLSASCLFAQTQQSHDEEKSVMLRFLAVLENNPREGVPLDRVYAYHSSNGSIDALLEKWEVEAIQNPFDMKKQLLRGLLLEKSGRHDEARTAYQCAAELSPDDFFANYYLGRALLRCDSLTETATVLERAVNVNTQANLAEHANAVLALGKTYAKLGDLQRFDRLMQRIAANRRRDETVLLNLIKTLEEEKFYDEAVARYSQILDQLEPNGLAYMQCRTARADANAKNRRIQEALADYEYVLDHLRADHPLVETSYDKIEKLFVGNATRLTDFYCRRIELAPDNINLARRYAAALTRADRTDEAEIVLTDALQRTTSDMELRMQLIDLLAAKKNYAAVEEHFAILEKTFPQHARHIIRRGEIALQNVVIPEEDRKSHARNIWRQLLNDHPDDVSTLILLGHLFDASGMPEDAETMFRRASQLPADDPEVKERLGQMTRFENLIRLYNKPGNEAATVGFYVRSILARPDIAEQPKLLDQMFGSENDAGLRDVELLVKTLAELSRQQYPETTRLQLKKRLDASKRSLKYRMQTVEKQLVDGERENACKHLAEMADVVPQEPDVLMDYASLLEHAGMEKPSLEWKTAAFRLDCALFFQDFSRYVREYQRLESVDLLFDLFRSLDDDALSQHAERIAGILDGMAGRRDRREKTLLLFDELWRKSFCEYERTLQYKTGLLQGVIWSSRREWFPYYREIVLELITPTNDLPPSDDFETLHNPHWVLAWASDQCCSLSTALLALANENELEALSRNVERIRQQHEIIDTTRRDWYRYTNAMVMQALLQLKMQNRETPLESLEKLEKNEHAIVPLIQNGAILGQEFAKISDERHVLFAINCFQKFRSVNRNSYGEVYITLQISQLQARLAEIRSK